MQMSEVMTRSVITAPPGMSLALAQRLMDDHHIRHLPVVQEGQLVGLVSDRDLRQALPSPTTTLTQAEFTYKTGTLAIATCMTREVVTANLAKTSLPSVGTEDDRLCTGPRRGFDKSYAPRHAMLYYIL